MILQLLCLSRSLESLNISSLTIWLGEMRLRARDFLPLLHLPSLKQLDVSDPPSLAGSCIVILCDPCVQSILN